MIRFLQEPCRTRIGSVDTGDSQVQPLPMKAGGRSRSARGEAKRRALGSLSPLFAPADASASPCRSVAWNEENLSACEAGKSATMKIDEPETPWASPPRELFDDDGARHRRCLSRWRRPEAHPVAAAPGAHAACALDLAARLSSALGKRAGREDGGGDSGTDPEGGEGGDEAEVRRERAVSAAQGAHSLPRPSSPARSTRTQRYGPASSTRAARLSKERRRRRLPAVHARRQRGRSRKRRGQRARQDRQWRHSTDAPSADNLNEHSQYHAASSLSRHWVRRIFFGPSAEITRLLLGCPSPYGCRHIT